MATTAERDVTCPHCGVHGECEGTRPAPGDFGICWQCGTLQVYTRTGLRAATPEEEQRLGTAKPFVRGIVEAVRRKVARPARSAAVETD